MTTSALAPTPAAVGAEVRRVLWVTLGLNLLVSAGKIAVGLVSGSLAMVADGYHSLVDSSNNVIGLVVAAFAYAPPDRGHPYGHRKFETAATVAIGAALLALAYHVVADAFAQATAHRIPAVGPLNWAVMVGTMAMNFFVSIYEAREGRRLGSEYLVADAVHTRSDLYVSLGVIASFAGAKAGFGWSDTVVAIVIAGVIATQAVRILVSAFNVLTDRAALPADRLGAVAAAVAGVRAVRDVRTRGGADAVYVDLIAHVDGDLSLRAAHDVADRIEEALQSAHPQIVDVVVHLEPSDKPLA